MKNIAVIPARGGSKRLPGKNKMLLGGIPLVVHSILAAKQTSAPIDEIYVSTDDLRIKEIALSYGAKVIDRPEYLSGDFEPTVSAVQHVVESLSFSIENVFLLQPTNPLRPTNLITDAFQIFSDNNLQSLMTVTRNYQKFGKIEDNIFVPYNYAIGQRSQDMEPLYFENGLLYITKAALILEGKMMSANPYAMVVDHSYADVDIDTQEDFDFATYLYSKKYST